ncbi:hypothetical protein GB937_009348 [Aspergillus fischeri]|nr:hypothetical protein GB937_009348 [Aspergillus fischeri]
MFRNLKGCTSGEPSRTHSPDLQEQYQRPWAPLCNRNRPEMEYYLKVSDKAARKELSVAADESQYHPK